MQTPRGEWRSTQSVLRLVVLSMCLLMLTGCLLRTNRTFVGQGPDFDSSWGTAHEALRLRGYQIESEDRGSGRITTVKRYNNDWWWIMQVSVLQNGSVSFRCSGSPNVNPEPKIHRRLLNFSFMLQRSFNKAVARGG